MYTIYSRANCPFCTKAKELLSEIGEEFEVLSVESRANLDDLITQLEYFGVKKPYTVPQIWGPDGYIPGGYQGLKNYLDK